MKRRILNYIIPLAMAAMLPGLSGCIDSVDPSSTLTSKQVKDLTSSQHVTRLIILTIIITAS